MSASLVLNNLNPVFKALQISRNLVLSAGPYHQRATQRQKGCQIDLLIQTKRNFYLCEFKLKSKIDPSVIQEIDSKVDALKIPKTKSIRTVLIYNGELAPMIEEEDALDFLIDASTLFV